MELLETSSELAQKAQEDFGREREREMLGDLGTLCMSSMLFDDVW